jgi:hypothetical protein
MQATTYSASPSLIARLHIATIIMNSLITPSVARRAAVCRQHGGARVWFLCGRLHCRSW